MKAPRGETSRGRRFLTSGSNAVALQLLTEILDLDLVRKMHFRGEHSRLPIQNKNTAPAAPSLFPSAAVPADDPPPPP